jgi:hypothetical protein
MLVLKNFEIKELQAANEGDSDFVSGWRASQQQG